MYSWRVVRMLSAMLPARKAKFAWPGLETGNQFGVAYNVSYSTEPRKTLSLSALPGLTSVNQARL